MEVSRPNGKRQGIQRVRGLVVTDPHERPNCFALIIDDETERFDAEDRFERAFAANPAPAIIARLSDMRYVKVNQGFLELTGYVQEALIGRSVHEIDVLEGALQRELAVERLHAGATIPQMEACLRVASGSSRTVIVAGQPLEIGDEACMLFTFADLHPRQQAEDALRQSEERFATAFRLAPGPMAIIAVDGMRLFDVNDAFTTATGWRREEVIGRTEAELGLWGSGPLRDELTQLIRQTGRLRSCDVQCRMKDGRTGHYLLSAETVVINDRRCVLTVMLDITERKRTEADLLVAIEAVMQDTSWFGQKIVEKLASLTRHRRTENPGPQIERPDAARARGARVGGARPIRRRDREDHRHQSKHGPQSRIRDLSHDRYSQAKRPCRMGARARAWCPRKSQAKAKTSQGQLILPRQLSRCCSANRLVICPLHAVICNPIADEPAA